MRLDGKFSSLGRGSDSFGKGRSLTILAGEVVAVVSSFDCSCTGLSVTTFSGEVVPVAAGSDDFCRDCGTDLFSKQSASPSDTSLFLFSCAEDSTFSDWQSHTGDLSLFSGT